MNEENGYSSDSQQSYYNTTTGYSAAPGTKPEKKRMGVGGIIAIALVCALLGGILGTGGTLFAMSRQNAAQEEAGVILRGERETKSLADAFIKTDKVKTAAEVYAENVNSTVGIATTITKTNYFGFTTQAASGSGFILTEDGYILTNYHVIENSDSVTVTTYDDTKYDAKVVGYDASNDIAVLKVEAQGLTPVVLGESSKMNVGDDVIAIGNPLGELTFSLTKGVISAKDREVTISGNITMRLFQTDCAINSGNSGGALFNMYGEVIGLTNAKYSSSGSGASVDNICFAIPIDHVSGIVESIIENGYIAKPYMGVSIQTVSSETQSYGLPAGAAVKVIEEGSPAAESGLEINDIITAVNGSEIKTDDDLVQFVAQCKPGDELALSVYRQGEELEIKLTLGEKITSATETAQQSTQQSGQAEQGQQGESYDPFYGFNPFSFFGF